MARFVGSRAGVREARHLVALLSFLPVLALGCGDEERPPPPCIIGCDAGPPCDVLYDPPPSGGDADGDGVPDDADDDADGDGIPNVIENYGGFTCASHDADGDGIDNWLDTDSDDDGLPDAGENGASDPYVVDSDGDGYSDLIEDFASTSPTDDESHPAEGSTALLVPHLGGDVRATITVRNRIENADVFFLVDTTGSMRGERSNLIAGIQRIVVPALARTFTDVAYGVGGLDDYPVGGYGSGPADGDAMASGDLPFYLITPMLDGLEDRRRTSVASGTCSTGFGVLTDGANGTADIVDALSGLGCHSGADTPESFAPALWATATGGALTWPGATTGVPAQTSCPPGHTGYPCFRPDAFPIVLMVGDAAFHNGPGGAEPYSFPAPTFDDAVAALNAIGAKVVSLYSGGGSGGDRAHYEALAMMTGAVGPDGTPMVFDIDGDGTGIDTSVIDAMALLAQGVPQDVSIEPLDDPSDAVDALAFVVGYTTGEGRTNAGAPGGYASKDATTFFTVEGGAYVDFVFTLRNDTVAATDVVQIYPLVIRAIGSAGVTFATRTIFLVVPPDGRAIRL